MATATEELSIIECTRRAWEKLGQESNGPAVAAMVKDEHGHVVPSSTISYAKSAVWGPEGRATKTKQRRSDAQKRRFASVRAVLDSPDNSKNDKSMLLQQATVLIAARDLLRDAGSKDNAMQAINAVVDLQV